MISSLFSAIIGVSAAATPVYPQLDVDLHLMKKNVVESLASTYQGDELVPFEELIINPVIDLIAASRTQIKNNLALRVYVRNYYSLVALSLGECDLYHAAKNDPTITNYSTIEPILKKIVQRKESIPTVVFAHKKKQCEAIMVALEKKFGIHFDAADLLVKEHHA